MLQTNSLRVTTYAGEPPKEAPMPTDPKEDTPGPEEPQPTEPVNAPAPCEMADPDTAPEIPEDDPFDDGNFPV
jgi:hypothetical protein